MFVCGTIGVGCVLIVVRFGRVTPYTTNATRRVSTKVPLIHHTKSEFLSWRSGILAVFSNGTGHSQNSS